MEADLSFERLVLSRTPGTLQALVHGLPGSVSHVKEGPEAWSLFDIVGHLIHGELTDWIPRARIILEHGMDETFESFDRFAQLKANRGKSLDDLLVEFKALRERNLAALDELRLSAEQLKLRGRHPDFGRVTMGQLIATWAVHDLSHIAQIARVMAKYRSSEVGPWKAYLPILGRRDG